MPLKTILIYIIILLLGITVGVSSLFLYFKINMQKIVTDYIKNSQLKGVAYIPVNNSTQVQNIKTKHVAGIVDSFEGNTLIIKANSMVSSTSGIREESDITVIINDKTKFITMTQKDMTTFQKEMEVFQNFPDEEKASSTPPGPFVEKETSRNLFTIGKLVVVKSIEEVTSSSKSVTAESVSLLPETSKVVK